MFVSVVFEAGLAHLQQRSTHHDDGDDDDADTQCHEICGCLGQVDHFYSNLAHPAAVAHHPSSPLHMWYDHPVSWVDQGANCCRCDPLTMLIHTQVGVSYQHTAHFCVCNYHCTPESPRSQRSSTTTGSSTTISTCSSSPCSAFASRPRHRRQQAMDEIPSVFC